EVPGGGFIHDQLDSLAHDDLICLPTCAYCMPCQPAWHGRITRFGCSARPAVPPGTGAGHMSHCTGSRGGTAVAESRLCAPVHALSLSPGAAARTSLHPSGCVQHPRRLVEAKARERPLAAQPSTSDGHGPDAASVTLWAPHSPGL